MVTLTFVLFGLHRAGRPQGQPAARPELSDADRAHRIHRRGADRNRDADHRAGRGSGRRGQEPAQAASRSRAPARATWCSSSPGAPTWTRPAWRCATSSKCCSLPLEAKAPVLLRFNPSHRADHAPGADRAGQASAATPTRCAELMRLRRYADDDLKKKLEPVDGVAAVKVGGGLEDEVQVDIDQQKLAQLNLPIEHRDRSPAAGERQHLRRPHRGRQRSATSCARSTSSPTSTRSATCWSPRRPQRRQRRRTRPQQMCARRRRDRSTRARWPPPRRAQSASSSAVHARSPAACRCG